eukprot:156756-Chlamydomonas_euryale.AAC.1
MLPPRPPVTGGWHTHNNTIWHDCMCALIQYTAAQRIDTRHYHGKQALGSRTCWTSPRRTTRWTATSSSPS